MDYVLIIFVAVVIVIGLLGYKIIPANKIAIIEHLGAYSRTIITPGVVYIKPFVEKIYIIDQLPTLLIENAPLSLNKNQNFEVSFELTYEILQAKAYYYLTKDSKHTIKALCLKEIRIYLEEHQVYDLLETKKELKAHLIQWLKQIEDTYHIQFKRLDLMALNKKTT